MIQKRQIHNRIKLYRTAFSLTREELAQKVGVNFQTIGYLERDEYNPSLELALKFAEVFETTVENIFSFTPFTPTQPL
jgi:putative transcriptional regulator